MASGGYRSHTPSSSNTTDFLEEWKAKREKMRAKMYAAEMAGASGATDVGNKTSNEMNNNNNSSSTTAPNSINQASAAPSVLKAPAIRRTEEEQPVGQQRKTPGPIPDGVPAGPTQEESPPPASQDSPSKTKDKGKICSGPSARKGKGQIEKRKLREKRRSTGVVNIPSAESPEDEDDEESGQKERKKEDSVTQHNTLQNESLSIDPNDYLQSERSVPNRYKSVNNAPDDEVLNRHSRSDRTCSRFNKDATSSQGSSLEKKIEELEKELAKERQENLRLVKMMQDKEELIMKMKEEIDLLNRDLDDIEDENKQLKQENKTLLKVVGQLTR